MLVHLTIRNYALIKQLEIDPSPHLTVITGETGAGKSIMLGAIGLLLGNRADTKVLWDDSEKCVIEATFDVSEYGLEKFFESEDLDFDRTTQLRREISSTGKSRAFINDTPVTLEILRKLGARLMDVHSQHETLELGNRMFQLHLVDAFAGNQKVRNAYEGAWTVFVQARQEFDALQTEAVTLRQEYEFTKFQLDELVGADFDEGEQEVLESQLKVMEHSEDIRTRFGQALNALDREDGAVLSSLATLKAILLPLSSYSPMYEQLVHRLEATRIELNDLRDEFERAAEQIDVDPNRLDEIKNRLSLIYQLLTKHRCHTLRDLLRLQVVLQEKVDKAVHLDSALAASREKLEISNQELNRRAKELTKTREKVFAPLCQQLVLLLKELGIPEARLSVHSDPTQPGPHGAETLELLFSANKGIEPRSLGQVASGGEFSRVMFCVKYVLAEKTSLPTLVLDEIDSGVSGEIALRLGAMMQDMAKRHQLITISHLPQIAAKGDAHYFVYKDNSSKKTVTHLRLLEPSERVEEIAKMIAGEKPSRLALENARELIEKPSRKG